MTERIHSAATRRRSRRTVRWPSVMAVFAVLVAMVHAGQVTVFQDDFEGYPSGGNPGVPQVGAPWQIGEFTPDALGVAADPSDPLNQILWFGTHRNIATAPLLPLGQQQITYYGNLTVQFDYFGFPTGGGNQYFDIGLYDRACDDPAVFLRIDPLETAGVVGGHDVYYRAPGSGLVDTGLDVVDGTPQTIIVSADLSAYTFDLNIDGATTSLPMLTCPSTVHDIEFSNYQMLGSGYIDNLHATVDVPGAPAAENPEPASIVLLAVFGLAMLLIVRFGRPAK